MNFINRLFKSGKKASTQNEEADICRILLPSFLAVMLCAACLVGSTFAWFSSTATSSTQTIQAANYQIEVAVKSSNVNEKVEPVSTNTYELKENTTYTVTLTATGTSSNGGYAKVTIGTNELYTEQLTTKENSNTMQFTVIVPQGVKNTMKVSYSWGTYSGQASIEQGTAIDYSELSGTTQS